MTDKSHGLAASGRDASAVRAPARRRLLGALALGLAGARPAGAARDEGEPSRPARVDEPMRRSPGGEYPFKLGVASGYPGPDRIVLWTRLVALTDRGDGGFDARPAEVRWEIARDERFGDVVAKGRVRTRAEDAHSLHVEVAGLEPARDYWYRFRTLGFDSPVGRTRTMPARGALPRQVRIAVAACQNYEHGYYGAWRHIAAEAPDLVVHLGDYLYEATWGRDLIRRNGTPEPKTLDAYRLRHMLYKRDPDLQRAHRELPWALTWDDHEVSNDYADDLSSTEAVSRAVFLARRAAAYRAYYEHMPLPRRMKPRGPSLDLYGAQPIGGLATLYLLDTRQYRSHHACPPAGRAGARTLDPADCPQLADPRRTMLGAAQERWIEDALRRSSARWNLIGQQTLFAPLDRPAADGRRLRHTDGWDGYPVARDRLLGAIARHAPANPVLLGGDVHAFYASRLVGPADARHGGSRSAATPIASEFVTTSITSQSAGQSHFDRLKAANPHILHADGTQRGYLRLTLTQSRLLAEMVGLADVSRADTSAAVQRAFVVEDGRAGPVPA